MAVVLALTAGCTGIVGGVAPAEEDTTRASRADGGRPRASAKDGGSVSSLELPDDDEPKSQSEERATSADQPAAAGACPKSREQPVARGLRIRELALYQTIKVPLYENGAWVAERTLPVVQNKRALVRVFVDTLQDYQPHPVRGVLTINNGGVDTQLLTDRTLDSSSSDELLATTFSFDVAAEMIGPNTTLRVNLQELDCAAVAGSAEYARFPVEGAQPLAATAVRKLRVVVVPITIGGRNPNTSQVELDKMSSELLAYYPVPAVELSVRQPLTWPTAVGPTDTGAWGDVLDAVMAARAEDAPDDDVYYFGLMQPAASFANYCGRTGCVLGLAPQTVRIQPSAQIGLGASFADAQTYETMVHELGHAHGRGHAPCAKGGNIAGVDEKFPQATGAIGSWGWDPRTNALKAPTYKDIMGYCEPNWISAYTYGALAARSLKVNTKARLEGGAVSMWRRVILYGDGTARWGSTSEREFPGGEVELADVLDAGGSVLRQIEVVRVPLSHVPNGAFLYLPEPEPDWYALALRDQTLELDRIAAAR